MMPQTPIPNDGLAPLLPPDAPCRMVVERIDPKNNTRWQAYESGATTLDEGIQLVEDYLKCRHARKWWIWRTGWMQFTCVRYDGAKLQGEYLTVRLEAATVAAN